LCLDIYSFVLKAQRLFPEEQSVCCTIQMCFEKSCVKMYSSAALLVKKGFVQNQEPHLDSALSIPFDKRN